LRHVVESTLYNADHRCKKNVPEKKLKTLKNVKNVTKIIKKRL